jgi:diaminopimelate decarboxylase
METLQFLTEDQVREIGNKYSHPVYVYSEARLRDAASKVLAFPAPFGLTVRFAMKACPNAAVLRLFDSMGLHIDASSGYEVERALHCGVSPEKVLLSAQELAHNLEKIIPLGVSFNACSLRQIEAFGKLFPDHDIGLRFNPGLGTGGVNRTNVGGPASSFGIWHEYINEAKALVSKYNLKVVRIHTHIGSGTDPEVWQKVSRMSVALPEHFETVKVINLGGGYKVGRMSDEKTTSIQEVGKGVTEELLDFRNRTGRELSLEIEPGTFLVALAGSVVARIDDIVDTGKDGYCFYKINTGMTEVLRPSIYGAQHPLVLVPRDPEKTFVKRSPVVVVVGHCCESGDILTPEAGDPEALRPRELPEAEVDDYMVIEGCGAYCSSMSTKNYNSFPEAAEVLLKENGDMLEIRKRQTLDQIVENEC